MQLALSLGMTADRLEREMTHRELRQWTRFARDHVMPFRRLEIYMQQICLHIATAFGGNEGATLDDFVIEFGPEREGPEPDVEEVKAAFGFSPRKPKP